MALGRLGLDTVLKASRRERGHSRRFLSAVLAGIVALVAAIVLPDGIKNVSALEAGDQVTSNWLWTGTSVISQRYGCTNGPGEDNAPSGWCTNSPYGKLWHHGIDIADDGNQPHPSVGCTTPYNTLPSGAGSPLYAGASGTVVQAGTTSYGTIIEWQRDIDSYYVVLYHTQAINVHTGDRLYTGLQLGQVGNSGWPSWSSACHLHFEIRAPPGGYWDDRDPAAWLTDSSIHAVQATASTRVSGDFLGTGYDASAVLYDFTNYTRILVWPNTTGSHLNIWSVWWDSTNAAPDSVWPNFDAKKAKIISGHFTGGQYTDIAILYDASDATCLNHAIWYVLKSTGSSFLTYKWWDSQRDLGAQGCLFAASRTKLVVGEFEGDGGTADVAAQYDEATGGCPNSVNWYVFLSTAGGGFRLDTPTGDPNVTYPWYVSGCNTFAWSQAKPIMGFFDGTVAQVAVFYDYAANCPGQPRSVVEVFHTVGSQFQGPVIKWDSLCNRFPWIQSIPVAGTFTGHNTTDVAVLFDSSSACQNQPRTQLYLLVWSPNIYLNGPGALQTSTQPPYDSQCGGFAWNWTKAEAGYFRGGAVADVAVLYYYTWHCRTGEVDSRWLVFVPSGTQFTGYSNWDTAVYESPPPPYPYADCNGVDWNRSTPT